MPKIYRNAAANGLGFAAQLAVAFFLSPVLVHALGDARNGIWSLYGACFPENEASVRLQLACGFRIVGRRERIAQQNGVWRDTLLTERRSRVVGS